MSATDRTISGNLPVVQTARIPSLKDCVYMHPVTGRRPRVYCLGAMDRIRDCRCLTAPEFRGEPDFEGAYVRGTQPIIQKKI